MKRFKKTVAVTGKTRLSGSGLIAMALATTLVAALPNLAAAQSDQGLLDEYLTEIERLISGNDLEGARDKLAEATLANLEDCLLYTSPSPRD